MHIFRHILINTLIASFATNFLWFALTFWMYLTTKSVIASSIVGACYPLFSALFGILFGTYVDHHKKKSALLLSGYISLVFFALAAVIYGVSRTNITLTNPLVWLMVLFIMAGAVAVNLRLITLSTLVTMLVPEKQRDRANGQVGVVNGLAFALTSVFSGLAVAYLGLGWSIVISMVCMAITALHLQSIHFKDDAHAQQPDATKRIDFHGSIAAVKEIKGLPAFILFTMINNLINGVFFGLMDPYGLELVSVQAWGIIWALLSFTFMFGGIWVAKKGLGRAPLKRLFQANLGIWIMGMIFPLQPSILLLVIGMLFYMQLVPIAEAAEQTVLQKIVPLKKQGRVFGIAQTTESLVSPVTALAAGPLTQLFFIPFISGDGRGVSLIGSWFGTGVNRGIGLLFITSSFIGLLITIVAFRSRAYHDLSHTYATNN